MKNIKTNRIDKEKLIEYYKKTGNAVKTGVEFGVSPPTVLKIARLNGVPVNRETKKYTDDYIISKYYELGTAEKTGIELGIKDYRVNNVLDRNNIERKKIKHIQIGDVFNKLTVIEFVGYRVSDSGRKNKIFLCKCECGGTKKVSSNKLTSLKKGTKDCGCTWKLKRETSELKRVERVIKKKESEEIRKQKHIERELNKKPPRENKYKIGYKHNRLTIISEIGRGNNKVFTVQCECGTIKDIKRLTITNTKSCGCLRREESTRRGHASRTNPERRRWYDRWREMIKRCYNPKSKPYKNYGGRGITVCERWRIPDGIGSQNYYEDIHTILGPQPSPEHSLDRINNDGPYEINNLRWATNSEQVKNQRRNLKK